MESSKPNFAHSKSRFQKFLLIALGACFVSAHFVMSAFDLGKKTNSRKKQELIPPPQTIERFAFGYHESLADSFWLRWIQDIEGCGKATVTRAEFEKTHKEEIGTTDRSAKAPSGNASASDTIDTLMSKRADKPICDRGWSFLLLDAVTKLAPKFRMPYALGATALTVITEDHMGAKVIFDRGIEAYPTDWSILYRAAYLYIYEIKDLPRAAELLNRAADNGAPSWLRDLAAKLYTRSGQLALGIVVLKDYYKTLSGENAKKDVRERIIQLEEALRASGSSN